MSRDFMNDDNFWDEYIKEITEMAHEEQALED